ncbi:MAG: L7Ae/L30e/S12e/Gadd45 family ribosomal protein [bacterium]
MGKIEPLFKILGFAQRARKLTLGMSSTLRSLHKGKTHAVILATDISKNTASKIEMTIREYNVPVYIHSTKDVFGQFFGRREVGIIGITDASFAKSISKMLK